MSPAVRVLVTGASGFVGGALCRRLAEDGYLVRAAVRREVPVAGASEYAKLGDLAPDTDWSDALRGVQAVIHTAARVHVLNDPPQNAALYHAVNAAGTEGLVEACRRSEVRRIVYLSTVKAAQRDDAYGASKRLGESAVLTADATGAIQGVVVRSPLVFGPGVRGNFLRLMRVVQSGVPVPLGSVKNQRSMVSVWNLVDLLILGLRHAAAPGGVFWAAETTDLSTPELIRVLAAAMRRPARLWPVPVSWLRAMGSMAARGAEIGRLCDSLVVDRGPATEVLHWTPPVSTAEGIQRTVRWFLERVNADVP